MISPCNLTYTPKLTSVEIPSSVTSINSSAFFYCNNLHKIVSLANTIPEGFGDAFSRKPVEGRIIYVANDTYNSVNNNYGRNVGTFKKYDYLSSYFDVDGIRYVPVSPSERTCAAIDCTYEKDVKKIEIGDYVTYRGVKMRVVERNPYLFVNNVHIDTLCIDASTKIDDYFAMGCDSLRFVRLNDNVSEIGKNAFFNCVSLDSIALPNSVQTVGKNAFYNCGVKYPVYNSQLFAYLPTTFEKYEIPKDIVKIAPTAFRDCAVLDSIGLPNGVTVIEESTFSGCSSLDSIALPKGVTTIKDYAFENSGLKSIVIPAATTSIGNHVFNGCSSLEEFVAKDGQATLHLGSNYDSRENNYWSIDDGKGLFYDCPLKEVVVGRNLSYDTSKQAGYSPFYRNTNIESVTLTDIPTEIFTNEFYGCTGLKTVSIGDGVTYIGDYAFSGCSAIETFTFGKSVERIGTEAFSDCTAMTALYAEPTVPPTCGTQALDDINKWECTLYVDASAIDAYRAADQWKEFFFVEGCDYGKDDIIIDIYDGSENVITANGIENALQTETTPNALYFIIRGEVDSLCCNFVQADTAAYIKLTDAEPLYCPQNIKADSLSYTRDFTSDTWQALYLPFPMSYEEWSDKVRIADIYNVHQYDRDDDGVVDETIIEFITIKNGEIEANKPYVVKPLETGETTFTVKDRTLAATPVKDGYVDCMSTKAKYTITGTYQEKADMYANGYYAMSGGNFMQASSASVTLPPFRTYLKIESRNCGNGFNAPRKVRVVVDGVMDDEATAVEGLTIEQLTVDHCMYNLSGQKVGADYKGIVVKNGRKVLQK